MNPESTLIETDLGALREVPYMGVIFVVAEAMKLGFVNGHPDWCNLGQGQPEVGEIAGAPPRLASVEIEPEDHAYGPLGGTPEMRAVVAAHYNRLYREGKRSKYTADNVCISGGGRANFTNRDLDPPRQASAGWRPGFGRVAGAASLFQRAGDTPGDSESGTICI